MMLARLLPPLLVLTTLIGPLGHAAAMETLTFHYQPYAGADQRTLIGTGQVLAEDSVGNRFFETDDGGQYLIAAADVIETSEDDRPFAPADPDTIGERLVADLGPNFRVHTTKHYVVIYDTSREYAEWTSSLLEGLYKALVSYWKKQGVKLDEPRFPMPVVIHRSTQAYNAASRSDGVPAGAIGYYHMRSNRVRMYDLSGSDAMRAAGATMRRGSRREITRMLSLPAAEPLVATIVHEATHQVCFNTGLLERFTELPIWLVEGMAVYFEAPQAGSRRGWSGIGKVNYRRLATFRRNLANWKHGSLTSLIASDDRLRDTRTAGAAYADAWALNYFLIKKRREDYVAYVKMLSARKPLEGPPADETDSEKARRRLKVFTDHFGDITELERDFLQVMSRL